MASQVPELRIDDLTAARFQEQCARASRPVVLRGLVANWPAVEAGRSGDGALAGYLKTFASTAPISVKTAPASERGRLFYDDTLTGFNFTKVEMSIGAALDWLSANAALKDAPYFAVQSVQAQRVLPGFAEVNAMPLLPPHAAPRLWIGNAVTVAAHYDPLDNLACVVAGRRRFTLFPPDQVANLYPGPFELTPAGPIVSMVDFDAPDLERYPGFPDAMAAALWAELAPGDAIYIPCLWWHHVRSLEPANMLVNYWWGGSTDHNAQARSALMHAMLAMKHLPQPQREAWRALFDHYAFMCNGSPGLHLPPQHRGIQGDISMETAHAVEDAIIRSFGRPQRRTIGQRAKELAARALRGIGLS